MEFLLFILLLFAKTLVIVDWSSVMMLLSLPKKLARHAVGVGLSFPYNTFSIERMIENKMIRSGFLRSG
jgi:hypothetical protein